MRGSFLEGRAEPLYTPSSWRACSNSRSLDTRWSGSGIGSWILFDLGAEREICCGSAGVYNVLQPDAAAELGARKARHVLDTGAEAIAAGNPGCAAQLDFHLRQLGRPLPIHHPIELVWRSIAAAAR